MDGSKKKTQYPTPAKVTKNCGIIESESDHSTEKVGSNFWS